MKNCILNDKTKWIIAHYHNNIIQLSGSSASSANEVSSSDDETQLKTNLTKDAS